MAKTPIWQTIEAMSPKKRATNVLKHQTNLNAFTVATKDCIDRLGVLQRHIERSEKKIVKALERGRQAEAISEILRLRVLRIDEMVELSALSLTRSNRFYNQLVLDVTKGVDANVKYNAETIRNMVPADIKTIMNDSVQASDFYDILSKYKDSLKEFVIPVEESA